MRRRRVVLAPLLLGLVAIPIAAAPPSASAPVDAVAGEVLVGLADGVTPTEVADLVRAEHIEPLPFRPDVLVVDVRPGDEDAAIERLLAHGAASWADRNRVVHAAARPSDPLYGFQWHLAPRTTARGGANWEPIAGTGATGKGVTVAVIDSGVTPNEDLDGVLPGLDLVDDDNDARDALGHGTHVAGTIAQNVGNLGAAGVASEAAILPIRALDATGAGTSSDFISAIAWASSHGARVINLSIAANGDGGMCDAVRKAVVAGAVVVASAGNDAAGVAFPAACPDAIAVSATTISGALAPYSNTGAAVTMAAPGGDNGGDVNLDGRPDGVLQYTFIEGKGGYSYWSGTSMAAPHVAGAAALLRSINPSLTPAAVRNLLITTAFDLGTPGADTRFGAGVLDIAGAVSAARQQAAPLPLPSVPSLPTVPPASGDSATGSTPSTRTSPNEHTARVAGVDRFATSAAASRAAFSGGAERAYLANGRSFADALAAGAAAGFAPGPILLTDPCSLPGVIADELRRLGPSEVVVIGGEAAVCTPVMAQAGLAAGALVRRVAGTDRYSTAAAISRDVADAADVVYLASGVVFADSLAGGAAAATAGGPLLLTAPCDLPAAARDELTRLAPDEVVVVGGRGAVCDGVVAAVKAASSARVRRVAGVDRFATSALLAAEAPKVDALMLASGVSFPDGLSAGGVAATLGSPLLLVPPCALPDVVRAQIQQRQPDRVTVFGGTSAVCEAVVDAADVAARG